MKIGIGIDTGGTYTDAVIYDFDNDAILGSAKALTTRHDLTIGILESLDKLPAELLQKADIVSLSTTLATNACVEDKGGNAKLIFFGGHKKTIDEFGASYGLPGSSEIYIQDSYTNFSGEIERETDWDLFIKNIDDDSFRHLDGAGIIEMNSIKNNAVVEKKAKELFQSRHDIPVVCGYELFNELNSLQRGASTLLNARLFPIIVEFLDAIKTAMKERKINADIVIVKSDGNLMSEEFSRLHPVETLLCGPAASALGGGKLIQEKNCIVVDMGGTTTDIAFLKDKNPVRVLDGVSIGKWKTFVDGLYIKTFGLGGDSAIHYYDNRVVLEDHRIVPLCVAAHKYPAIVSELEYLVENVEHHTKPLYEFYILNKNISADLRYTDEERKFCAALTEKPLMMREAADAVGKDIYTLNVSRLIREGIVQISGLTPTDIMHLKSDFNKYDTAASLLGARFVANNLHISVDELCDTVYDEIKRKIYVNCVKAMLENQNKHYLKNGVSGDIEDFIRESYDIAKSGIKNDFLSMFFGTDFVFVGIGAPVHIFLDDVAKMLGTRAVIPKYYEVANALGAICGNIFAAHTIEIKPDVAYGGSTGYVVFGNTENRVFKDIEEAEEFAMEEARSVAYSKALSSGAKGEISVTFDIDRNEAAAKDSTVYLGTKVTANAFSFKLLGKA